MLRPASACSASAGRKHGLNHIRWQSSSPSLPVAEDEFSTALSHVLAARWDRKSTAALGKSVSEVQDA